MGIKKKLRSVMENKVSRRVAIGSIAAGLGGAALVINALKSKYHRTLSACSPYEDQFVRAWVGSLKKITIPSQTIEGPSSFSLRLNVPEGKAYDVFVLNCSFEGENVEPLDPAVFPLVFSRTHAIMKVKRLAGKDSLVLPTKADLFQVLARDSDPAKGLDTSTGEYVFVPHGNRIGEVILSDGSTRAFPNGKLPLCCTYLAAAIWSYLPRTAHIKPGAKLDIPVGLDSEFALPCEVAGFARMAGKDTVVISSHLGQQDFQGSNNRCIVTGFVTGDKTHNKIEILKPASKGISNDLHLTAHFDLETGLPVHQEMRSRSEVQMPNSHNVRSFTEVRVSRILNA